MRRATCLALVALLFLSACGQKQEASSFQVGGQRVALVVPEDWEHFDYGEQHQWRRDFERITIMDLGSKGSYLDLATERALEELGENQRRETASLDTLTIGGRLGYLIDTWETVSHQYRKRYLFVLNERSLLALYTMQGRFENMAETFDMMATSLAFIDSVEQTGLSDGSLGD